MEASRAADCAFVQSLMMWLSARPSMGVVLWPSRPRAAGAPGDRLACLGVLFGPFTALLVHCLVTCGPAQVVLG